VLDRSGQLTCSWELARAYGFTDADGSRPDWGKHFATIATSIGFGPPLRRLIDWLDLFRGRAECYLGKE
jgi:hypothetical protein